MRIYDVSVHGVSMLFLAVKIHHQLQSDAGCTRRWKSWGSSWPNWWRTLGDFPSTQLAVCLCYYVSMCW